MVIDVLVIDDEPGILDILKLGLETYSKNAIRVKGVGNSSQATQIKEYFPKVVILDQFLEGEEPEEVLIRIRKRYPKAQILGYSGHPKARNVGYNDFKQKPLSLDKITQTVYNLAKNVPQTGENPQLSL